jgi:CheY-like chemotaxis protein
MPSQPQSQSQARILIVDDNPQNAKLMTVLLRAEGYAVDTAPDAERALQVLDELKPKLILMDIQLPGMDGLELTRRLKADPKYRHIQIVALTAYAMKGDDEKARAAGCDDYVTKPIDMDHVSELIARLINQPPP